MLEGGLLVTQDPGRRVLEGDLLVGDDGRIAAAGKPRDRGDRVLDCRGCAVLPGLINAHTHVANTLLRGAADDLPLEALLERTFALDARFTRRDVRAGAALGGLEMIRGGTTSFLDLFYWEDEVARAVEPLGLRGFLGWAILDPGVTTQEGDPLDNCRSFIHSHRGRPRIQPLAAFQGVYACGEETLLKGLEMSRAEGAMRHLHLSETRREVYDHQRKHGARPVEWLSKLGFLGPDLSAAHLVWVTIREVELLAAAGTAAVHCPNSNMKLASGGAAPLPEMFQRKVTVALGTDSPVSNNSMDMFREMKAAALLQKAQRWDAAVVPAQAALDMATLGGAALLGRGDLGSLEVGKRADIAVVDLRAPHLTPHHRANVVSHLVYACTASDVRHTVVDGRVVMGDRRVVGVDEAAIVAEAQAAALQLLGMGP